MIRKKLAIVVAAIFFLTSIVSPSLAAQAIVLSDAELDNIYAKGLNLNFNALGQVLGQPVTDIANNPANSTGITGIAAPATVHSDNQSVQIINPQSTGTTLDNFSNNNPNTQTISTNDPAAATQILTSADNANSVNPAISAEVPNLVAGVNTLDNSILSSNNNGATQLSPTSIADTSGLNTIQDVVSSADASPTLTPSQIASTAEFTPVSDLAQNDTLPSSVSNIINPANDGQATPIANLTGINNTNDPGSAVTPANTPVTNAPLASNADPSTSLAPSNSGNQNAPQQLASSSTNSSSAPYIFDITAGESPGGNLKVLGVDTNVNPKEGLPDLPKAPTPDLPERPGGVLNASPLGNGGINIVNVGDQSQQFLQALVNVNSAGGTVPVLININFIINSTVENVTNTNNLDIRNYISSHYQFR